VTRITEKIGDGAGQRASHGAAGAGEGVCVMFDAQSTFALAATSLKGKF
jgi:hypothetical protein